ncbi:MAG: complex I subunit 1 family protein [Sandaracinaceae bacterium]|nr:MAG: NADH-quinone oxidoreductase subunit H [Sandaracinaceae bacterium]HBQ19169.1 NADH-quinone oxidoreductase subunit H [Myxococcales bacterium]
MILLLVSTLAKIGFVLALLLGVAPLLVWAERRQSSMIQDRVGPVRAGIPLPAALAEFIRGPMAWGAKAVSFASLGFAALAFIGGMYFLVLAGSRPVTESGMSANTYFWMAFVALVVAAIHYPMSWVVKHSVDKRNMLTVFGLIHPAVDSIKMFWKEDFVPPNADKFLFHIAPIIALIPALATYAVIPFGPDLYWGPEGDPLLHIFGVVSPEMIAQGTVMGTTIPLQVANLNVGILYIFAIAGTGIVGAAIAGYSSDNKYSLLGGLRAASQMVSYEVTLGLTLVGCFMVYGTLLLDGMVQWQVDHVWGVFIQPLGFILFFFAAIAEMKRVPFDAPEGESEIVAGYFLEYSGFKFGMFMTGEFLEHIVSGSLIAVLFFGGYDVPFLHSDGFHFAEVIGYDIQLPHVVVVLIGVGSFLLKTFIFVFLFLQVRWTLPRFRYDQIMQLCWKIILPLSLANILITGVVILMIQGG